jgi:hypothetical protein
MGILQRIKQSFLATRGGCEMSSSNGLPHAYALLRARGEGGNPDPELEAVLARNALKLKEKRKLAQLEREVVVTTVKQKALLFAKKSGPGHV